MFPWQYTVREAAKAADLWNSAPYLDEISPEQMQRFYDVVCLINGEVSSVARIYIQCHLRVGYTSLPCTEQWSSAPERAPERHLNEQEDVFEIHKQEVACQKVPTKYKAVQVNLKFDCNGSV